MPLDQEKLKQEVLDSGELPRHVAVIMDGNGRWAKERKMPRIFGHREGRKSVRRVLEAAVVLGIEDLTLYTFSMENWNRPAREVKALMKILIDVLDEEFEEMMDKNIRLSAMGRLSLLPEDTRKSLKDCMDKLSGNTGTRLNLALSYGGQTEIVDAVRKIAEAASEGSLDPQKIDESNFPEYLYLPDLPPVDLLIRTSGESRISNFCLWHLAYSEIHLSDTLWPDFGEKEFYLAVRDFQGRERRYGR
ncbi:MAG: polyprenyl diphosphate synthase [Candidatus Krumholzibacteria bacterium]|jgi:undecaprenyl diphosphate synthase|nr:polyprenyl diphosphate synthase [Candidatus Krumholzibacteria bacterium]MDP6669018.1 polyprenyl diphosphate synthase [Candidatus Krumholzibacteria bacterium]MDP6796543.1 polyprenyl diphosphate synthase [Candidatus Krumholzibacteria bacterium]MDP7021736.1 polyprenyl diphosphate synthase [Candidatus Krumholzibacteria bacterium]